MKNNTKKSSITLPPKELKMVQGLMQKLGAKSKVEIIRKGLFLLKSTTDREELKQAYHRASQLTRTHLKKELDALDHLSDEGLDKN